MKKVGDSGHLLSDKFNNVTVKGGKLQVSRGIVKNSDGDAADGVRYKLTVQPKDKHLAPETQVFRVHKEGSTVVVSDLNGTVWKEHDNENEAMSTLKGLMKDHVKETRHASARVGGY